MLVTVDHCCLIFIIGFVRQKASFIFFLGIFIRAWRSQFSIIKKYEKLKKNSYKKSIIFCEKLFTKLIRQTNEINVKHLSNTISFSSLFLTLTLVFFGRSSEKKESEINTFFQWIVYWQWFAFRCNFYCRNIFKRWERKIRKWNIEIWSFL